MLQLALMLWRDKVFGWPLSSSGSGSVGESGRGSPSGGRGSRSWCPGSLEGDMLLADVRWYVDVLELLTAAGSSWVPF